MSDDLRCFTCKTRPAGSADVPFSAFCDVCQPRAAGPQPRGAQCACAACGRMFATLGDFDRHHVRPDGVFKGECLDPASLGLELAGEVWGSPAGNAHRAGLAARMARQRVPVEA